MEGNRKPEYYEDEIELIEYLRVIWRRKFFIFFFVVLCASVATAVTIVKYPMKAKTECTIQLNFSGIESAKNPDGSQFDRRQIISPMILSRVCAHFQKEERQHELLGDIRALVSVEPVILPEIQEAMATAKKEKESYAFFPNQFVLNIATRQETDIFHKGEKSKILRLIVDE